MPIDSRVSDSRSLLLQIAESAIILSRYINHEIENPQGPDKTTILDRIDLLRKRAESL